ncbi:uncharacterized protein LOC125838305 [Solanum verrucosum]|uniref:uncharacterized protein LOC125838305 n=1 Tax=Solanum verrucosum TaxID=315347 RepID=UPI0020D13BD8|nr:uncharacterized protein LOC125838305 [Solanum verrucosum]
MSVNDENSYQAGNPADDAFHRDDIDDINSVYNLAQVSEIDASCIPQADRNATFEVTSTTLRLIHSRGLYGGSEHEDSYEHIRSFIEVCTPLSFKTLSQECIRLRLFPLSFTGEATKWLIELPKNSIKLWEESEEPRRYCHDWAEQDDHEEDRTQLSESPKSKGSANSPQVNDLFSRMLDKVEGSDDLLKRMKDDFSSLNSKVNSHVDAIRALEGQLSLLSAQLTSRTLMKYNERGLVVVTRSGKMEKGNVMEDEDLRIQEESQGTEELELHIPQNLAKEPQEDAEQHVQIPKVTHLLPRIPPPFPQLEELLEMPGYAKFMKELITKKMSLEYETIEVHSCNVIMTNESITKREDPGAFTIACTIGMLQFAKALCDLGASINLMPYAIYKQLGLGEPKATTIRLFMDDRSIKHHVGILHDIMVKVDRFIFPTNFVILDCEIDTEIPIILGRTFLVTGRALVDIEGGKLKFRVNDNEVTFNSCKSMKQPSNIHVVSTEDVIDEAVASVSHLMCKNEPLDSVLANYEESKVQGYEEVVAALSGLGEYSRNPIKLDIDLKNRESPPANP